jgi:hypothetical protein
MTEDLYKSGTPTPQGLAALQALAKQTLEQRRYERMRASLTLKYRLLGADEAAALAKQGAYVAPDAFKGNTAETRDFNKLASEDSAVSEDISLGGLKLSTPLPLAEGTHLWLELQLPEVPIPVSATAEVRWCREADGQWSSGLKFSGISKTDLDKVERFLVLQKRAQIAKRG